MPPVTRSSRETSLEPAHEPSESADTARAGDAIPPAVGTASGFPEQVNPYTGGDGGAAAKKKTRKDSWHEDPAC